MTITWKKTYQVRAPELNGGKVFYPVALVHWGEMEPEPEKPWRWWHAFQSPHAMRIRHYRLLSTLRLCLPTHHIVEYCESKEAAIALADKMNNGLNSPRPDAVAILTGAADGRV